MNCCKCGKRLPAGVVLCLTCEKDYKSVPDENARIGYYTRNPEPLAECSPRSAATADYAAFVREFLGEEETDRGTQI